jgi:hypothetical protein
LFSIQKVQTGNSDLERQQDPFFDEAVDVSIGKALIYLEPLNYLMDIEERTSIYDFKGKSMVIGILLKNYYFEPVSRTNLLTLFVSFR